MAVDLRLWVNRTISSWRTSSVPLSRLTLLGALLVGLSWFILKEKSRACLQVYDVTTIGLIELLSLLVVVPGYALLLRVILLPAGDISVMSPVGRGPIGRISSRAAAIPHMAHSSLERRGEGCTPCTPKKYAITVACFTAFLVVIHIVVHSMIPKEHRQSQEIVLLMARVLVDGIVLTTAVIVAIRELWRWVLRAASQRGNASQLLLGLHRIKTFFFVLGTLYLLWGLGVVMGTSTIPHLRVSILGDPMDPCSGEGMELDPNLAQSWVLPAIFPRRLYNFYMGPETCSSSIWQSFAFVDKAQEVLVLPVACRDGKKPRVYIERPERSEFNGDPTVKLIETKGGNIEYHRRLEELYKNPEEIGVIVHRESPGGRILSVEWDPATLVPIQREPRSDAEKKARANWPSKDEAILVPLGRSAAYSVDCDGEEEYFVHPLKNMGKQGVQPWKEASENYCYKSNTEAESPASNVLILMFDAVSRQGVVRRLPKFVKWVREFKERQAKEADGYILREMHHTTLGVSTSGNVGPYLAGTSENAEATVPGSKYEELNFLKRSLFNLAKQKYGEQVTTSMTTGYCSDITEYLIFGHEPTSGRGERLQGIDYYTFQPFCHAEYGGRFGNYQGPYSIVQRCIDKRFVHEYLIEYLEALVRRHNDEEKAYREEHSCEKYAFHMAHFIEGHEGTHGSIATVDEGLTRMMEHLDTELDFFKNPKNTLLIIGDHGNHMGPYYEFFHAGKMERTTPAMLYFIHPQTFERVDRGKRREKGTSLRNFMERSRRVSTPLDFHLTLADLLGISSTVSDPFKEATVPAASLFDQRPQTETWTAETKVKNCFMLFNGLEPYKCLLDYCTPLPASTSK